MRTICMKPGKISTPLYSAYNLVGSIRLKYIFGNCRGVLPWRSEVPAIESSTPFIYIGGYVADFDCAWVGCCAVEVTEDRRYRGAEGKGKDDAEG